MLMSSCNCNPLSAGLSRRGFLLGASAGVAAMGLNCDGVAAQPAAAPAPFRIDVHHHLSPPAYVEELAPMQRLTKLTLGWTPERAIEQMDKGDVAVSITSITTPGLWFGSHAPARRLARACNDYAASLVAQYPRRFGMFVNMPLPDIDGSLAEIAYGLDVLKADGISLFTSYGDKWLGDPAFDPVFEELNRREAVVYTHPNTANCCTNLVPEVADSMVEYGTDTTRAIARMLFGGAAKRYPKIKLIWSHGGGTMPFLVDRFINNANISPRKQELFPTGAVAELGKFYYDVAQVPNRPALLALQAAVPNSQLLFGTDFPYLTAAHHVAGIAKANVFSKEELAAIDRTNALRLLPKYQG
ncbi:MAG: hypothetical protein JWO28_2973 [Hyphomicrobiales bacterium]|jgi:predicted TIM-barrel fold metal-dependent hydrolase|nr:hypothetical protein [Hyphomicrobiales bacterium]